MGQSTVVATAFTAIMFVAGVSILIMSTVSGFGTLSEALTTQAEQRDIVLNERKYSCLITEYGPINASFLIKSHLNVACNPHDYFIKQYISNPG